MKNKTIESLLVDLDEGYSKLQLTCFITQEPGLTAYGIFRQCLIELNSRDKILKTCENEDVDKKEIEKLKREIKILITQATFLKKQVGVLTPERRETLDEDMWYHIIRAMILKDFFRLQTLSESTIDMIAVLPESMQQRLLKVVRESSNVNDQVELLEQISKTQPLLENNNV